jgi:hypothetical protein
MAVAVVGVGIMRGGCAVLRCGLKKGGEAARQVGQRMEQRNCRQR